MLSEAANRDPNSTFKTQHLGVEGLGFAVLGSGLNISTVVGLHIPKKVNTSWLSYQDTLDAKLILSSACIRPNIDVAFEDN